MTPKPKPPRLSPVALAKYRALLARERELLRLAYQLCPHPDAVELAKSLEADIAHHVHTYPEAITC